MQVQGHGHRQKLRSDLFMAALGLRCYTWSFSSCGKWKLLFLGVCGLLIVVASSVAEHGSRQVGFSNCSTQACGLSSVGLVVMANELSCSMACEIFPDQG